jgi:(hydroxyamino)benzene mutase
MESNTPRQLKMLGMLLFLFGLITGFIIMSLKNPRMGLSAHLEGLMNGTFLIVAGFVWNELKISNTLKRVVYGTLVFGTFANWIFTLMAAFFGTSQTTPIAGAGFMGSSLEENLVTAGLVAVGLAMVFSAGVMAYGLRGKISEA